MQILLSHRLLWFVLILLAFRITFAQNRVYQETITDEKELKVRLNFAGGRIDVVKTNDPVVYRLTLCGTSNEVQPVIRYNRSGTTGYLTFDLEKGNISVFDESPFCWKLELTSQIPVIFQADIGAGKGQMDFTDIRLRESQLNFGASSMKVSFNAPNRERMRQFTVHAGLAKVKMFGLQYANMEKMEFNGGIGSYVLNFEGLIRQTSSVQINLGVGKMLMEIPSSANIALQMEKNYLTSFSLDKDLFVEKTEGTFFSKQYSAELPQMLIRMNAGVGKVSIVKVSP